MGEDASIKYLAAKREYDKARKDVKEMVAIIEKTAEAIKKNPSSEDIGVVNFGRVVGTSTTLSTPRVLSALHLFDAEKWPDAKQIISRLNALNNTYVNTRKAWKLIPESEKSNLVPPDKILRLE